MATKKAAKPARSKSDKPNILFIMADDIGWFNASCYHRGVMGYQTPNIRSHREGRRALHRLLRPAELHGWTRRVSSRASRRSAPASPRSECRGATLGLSSDDPSIGEFMKGFGYATGQFGKNHLGDRNEHLPTVHGFDEFFGNLYHLNAEEEPYYDNYPKGSGFPQEVRSARRAQMQGDRQGRLDRRPAVRPRRQAGPSRTPVRCPRSAWKP